MLLLTGATGTTGAALLRRLTATGVPTRVLVRDTRTYGLLLEDALHPDHLRDALDRGVLQPVDVALGDGAGGWVVCTLALRGDVDCGLLIHEGRFTYADSRYVWGILAGSAVGLLAATLARLVSSSFYALRDTRTPLGFAVVRIGLGIVLGVPAALYLPGALGIDERWGAAFLTASSGVAGWVELLLLRRRRA